MGGDIFYRIHSSKEGYARFLNGSGRATKKASIDYYLTKRLEKIQHYRLLTCITVPGCVSGWENLKQGIQP